MAVVLVGLNLRTVFASLPPLLDRIRDDLGLSATVAGLLTTGPVLCFGALALLAPRIVRRVPIERAVAAAAGVTALGAGARGLGVVGLFAGTILAGAGVAIAQTVLPILLRTRFGGHTGSLTGAFSMALTLGAALAAGTVVPLERLLDSWRGALALFAVPGALGALLWLLPKTRTVVRRDEPLGLRRDRRAWSVALFFALQSMAFYAGLTWLPSILHADGYSEASAGALQALASAVQFGPAFLVPVLAARRSTQTSVLVVLVVVAAGALVGILVAPGAAVAWMTLVGLAQGGALGLALILPVLRGGDAHAVASLTAMALSGYVLAAAGPWLVGLAHDVSGGWNAPLVLLVAMTLAELAVGVPATRAWRVR